jgi:serine/threonine-protein kinase
VRVLDDGEGPYGPYLVMERVDGEPLESRLARRVRLPTTQALDIACSLLEILDHLHAEGIFHGGLSPREILVEKRGTLRLVDFVGACGGEGHTRSGLSLGPAPSSDTYVPPGAGDGSSRDLTRTDLTRDVFASAAILYRSLTGAAPHTHEPGRGSSRAAPPLGEARPDLPATFCDVVEQALDADTKSPFDSAGSLRRSLIEAWTLSWVRRSG